MMVPGHPDLQQNALVVLFIPATSTNTLSALGSSTGAHMECIYCNMHCVVVVVVYIYTNIITNMKPY